MYTVMTVAAVSLVVAIWGLIHYWELKALLRSGLEKAERDRCYWVRIPADQVREVGIRGRLLADPHPSEFNKKNQTRHPALLSASRRSKL